MLPLAMLLHFVINNSLPSFVKPSARCMTLRSSLLRVFDSRSGSKLGFNEAILAGSKSLNWYICGPTVYEHSHLGHARTYVTNDIIGRVLQRVFHIPTNLAMNITDIDDKILAKANTCQHINLAREMEKSFLEDMHALGVSPPNSVLRVTEHIPEIINFIAELESKGFAYTTGNGDVWFDTQKMGSRYGKLKPRTSDSSTEETQHPVKRHAFDFALWKSAEGFWESPWGPGRPGWHIECSAMATSHFGRDVPVHLHSGGVDLKFPHHNNEIAQCEACFGIDNWVNAWMHFGHLHIAGMKMSKSLKNFITIKQFLKDYSADQFRMFCLLHKYGLNIEFSNDRMADASSKLTLLHSFVSQSGGVSKDWTVRSWGDEERALNNALLETQSKVFEALCDDFDTPKALSSIFQLTSTAHIYTRGTPDPLLISLVRSYIISTFDIFGISLENVSTASKDDLSPSIDSFVEFRETVRRLAKSSTDRETTKGLFTACDVLRDAVAGPSGITIEDGASRTTWRKN